MTSSASTDAPPPFDAATKETARLVAVAAGKPKTSEVGLKAIHAALHRACFSSERLAWEHFGVSKRRFYEWKPHATPPPPPSINAAEHDAASKAAAAAAARERKSELQRQRRHGEGAVLQALLSSLITQLEHDAARKQRAHERAQRASEHPWHCPAGCAGAADCARAAFRLQRVPTDDAIRDHLRACWRQQHDLVAYGDFRGPSGCRFVRHDEQVRCWREQEDALLEEYRCAELCFDAELDDIKRDFLATWDGMTPTRVWLECGNMSGMTSEDCGATLSFDSDRFGHSPSYEVGVLACARRGCMGCCYCRDQPTPAALYVNLVTHGPVLSPYSRWVTVEELRREVWSQIGDDEHSKLALSEPVPPYLLERQPDLSSFGGVMQVSGAVRRLIEESELAAWTEDLQGSMLLQVLSSDADACSPNPEEEAACDAHVRLRGQALSERTAAIKEREQLNGRIRHEAHKGCGQRVTWEWDPSQSNMKPTLKRGDIVYHPPPADRSTEAGVGVVTDVRYAHGGISDGKGSDSGVRSGYVDVLFWNFGKRCFGRSQEVWEVDFTLLPPCCGRGAGCPHLLLSQEPGDRRYPNGDVMHLKDLQAIPEHFQAKLDTVTCSRKERRALEESYAALLDPLGERRRQSEAEEQDALAKRQRLYTPSPDAWLCGSYASPPTHNDIRIPASCSDVESDVDSIDWGSCVYSECDSCSDG